MYSKQKRAAVILSFIAAAWGCGSARNAEQTTTTAAATWQAQELVINGNDSEWVGSMAFYNEKLKFGYTVSNDRSNLYVRLLTTDPQAQQQILRGGLTVLINSHGVKDEHGAAGISFPTGNLNQQNNTSARPELNSNINIALSNARDYSIFGFTNAKTVENYDLGKANPDGIEVGIGLNASNAIVYEAKLPFTAIFNQSGAVNAPGRNIAVGFVLDEIPSEQAARNGRGGGVSVGGGFGFGSFGSGGGIGISIGTGALGGGGRGGKLKQSKIWKELVLAKDPSR